MDISISTKSRKKKQRSKRQKRNTVVVINQTKSKRQNRRRRRLRGPRKINIDKPLASLIADPCQGPLVQAVNGSQITERFRTTVGTSNLANGYVVWFPSYHSVSAGDNSAFNAFMYESATTNSIPTNSNPTPLATNTVSTTGIAVSDPTGAALNGTAYNRAQTLSACLQLEFIGPLATISGQVALIPNFTMRDFNDASTGVSITAPTVDTLFAFAATRERLQVSGHEVIYRPSDDDTVMRTNGQEYNVFAAYQGVRPNTVMTKGVTGTSTSVQSLTETQQTGICIAWRGIPVVAGSLSINLVKVAAMELSVRNGIQAPYLSTSPTIVQSPFDTMTSWLDRNAPDWQVKAMNAGKNIVGQLAQSYAPMIRNRVMSGLRGRADYYLNDL